MTILQTLLTFKGFVKFNTIEIRDQIRIFEQKMDPDFHHKPFKILSQYLEEKDLFAEHFHVLLEYMYGSEWLLNCCKAAGELKNKYMLTQDNFTTLLKEAQYAAQLAQGFAALSKENILTSDNIKLLFENPAQAKGLGEGLAALNHAHMLIPANRKLLIDNIEHAAVLGASLNVLKDARLLNAENLKKLIKKGGHENIWSDLWHLQCAKQLTQDYFRIIMAYSEHCNGLGKSIAALHEAKLATPQNIRTLIENRLYAPEIGSGLNIAKYFLTQAIFDILIENSKYANSLGYAFYRLFCAGILNEANILKITAHKEHAQSIASGLQVFQANKIPLEKYFDLLIDYSPYASELAQGICNLNAANLLTDENLELLKTNAPYAHGLSVGIKALKDNGISFKNILIQHKENALHLGRIAEYLKRHNELTLQNIILFIDKIENIKQVSNGLLAIKESMQHIPSKVYVTLLKYAPHAEGLGQILSALAKERINNTALYETILENANYAQGLGETFILLQNRHLLTEFIATLVVKNSPYASAIARGIRALKDAHLLTAPHFDQMMRTIATLSLKTEADKRICVLTSAMSALAHTEKLSKKLFEEILANPDQALMIAYEHNGAPEKSDTVALAYGEFIKNARLLTRFLEITPKLSKDILLIVQDYSAGANRLPTDTKDKMIDQIAPTMKAKVN